MKLWEVSVRRPVLATVMSLVIIIFGVIAFTFLGVREFPSTDSPIITVQTNYPGANANVIESQITEVLEESVNGVEGIRSLVSTTREGRSTIQVEFALDEDLDRAANDVRDRVNRVLGQLPPDVDPPQVSKAGDDERPILFLNVYSDRRDLLDLTRIAEDLFAERLQTISGVSRVDVWGSRQYAMRLRLDPSRLAAYRLSLNEVRDALDAENVELPSGNLEGDELQLTIRTLTRLETEDEFNDVILRQDEGGTVRLRDVGRAELAAQNERTILKREGVPMVGVVIRPLPGANNVAIADEFHERLDGILADVPDDIQTAIGFDVTEFIRDSIREVQQTVLIALLLVIMVIFLFLRDWRTTVVPVITIPVALIGAFFIMFLLGFTINVLTLLAVVLAIGIVVDDAIVVVENIYKKIEAGEDPIEGSIDGTREIFFAIVSTTLALVAVFLPIIFLGGLTGQLFTEFGMTLAGAVVISSFVALSLAPMLCSKLLKKREEQPWFHRRTQPFFDGLTGAYRRSLEAFLARRWLALPLVAVCVGVGLLLFQHLPEELAPTEDRGGMQLIVSGPEGATFAYMDERMDRLSALVEEEVPEYRAVVSVTSPGFGASSSVNSGFVRLALVDASERDRSQQEIASHLRTVVGQVRGIEVFVAEDQTIRTGGGGGLPVQYVLQAPTLEDLREVLPDVLEAARNRDELSAVDVDLTFDSPEIQLRVDRQRARDLGIATADVGQALQLALSEQRTGFFVMDGQQYDVITEVDRDFRRDPRDLRSLYVRSSGGEPIQLDNLVSLEETAAPPQLYRFDRFASATISAGLADGRVIGDGIRAMDEIADELLDARFTTSLTGPSRDFVEGGEGVTFVFVLALLLVFLILAAQFESFRDPLIIMFTVPLALVGALVALWAFGQTVNIFSQIGMIMLIGLVTKNGILIVEFANQRKAQGLSVQDAIRDGAAVRFRPVLMTSISTALGILPLALALGAGAESRMPMGIAVIGGLAIGTLLTLYVVPAMYSFLSAPAKESSTAGAAAVLLVGLLAIPAGSLGAQTPAPPAPTPATPDTAGAPPLTLDEALRTTLERNPTLELARNQVARARNQEGLGAAGFLPELSVSGQWQQTVANTEQTFQGQDPQELRNARTRQGGVGAAAEWRLFQGFARFDALRRLEVESSGLAAALDGVTEEILATVIAGYFDLVRQERQVEVLEAAVELSGERLRLVRVREEVGSASDLEVRQARVDRNEDRAELLRARSQLAESRADFNRLLGRGATEPFRLMDTPEVDPDLPREELRTRALESSPDLRQAEQQLAASRLEEREERARRLPVLDVSTGLDWTDLSSESGFQQATRGWEYSFGLQGSLVLFGGFDRTRARTDARLASEAAAVELAEVRAGLEADFEVQWVRYQDQLELVELEAENLEIARRNVETALQRFQLGGISSLELREVQEARVRAETRLLESEFSARTAQAELERLGGRLLP